MSVDSRFQNIEYLFYVLSMIEQEQFVSTINVCSKLRQNQERVNNLHVYTKGLRGNYIYNWKYGKFFKLLVQNTNCFKRLIHHF